MDAFAPCIARGCVAPGDLVPPRGDAPAPDRAALADYLAENGGDVACVCRRLRADVALARARGDVAHETRLLAALAAYLVERPGACR